MKRVLLVTVLALVLVMAISVPALAGGATVGMGAHASVYSSDGIFASVSLGGDSASAVFGVQNVSYYEAFTNDPVKVNISMGGAQVDIPVTVVSYFPYALATGHLVASFRAVGDLVSDPVHYTFREVYPDSEGRWMWVSVSSSSNLTRYADATWTLTCEDFGLSETLHVSAADQLATISQSVSHQVDIQRIIGGPPTP